MIITYTPTGAQPIVFERVQQRKLMSPEAEAIERITGRTIGQVFDALEDESVTSMHAILWVLMKRRHPTLKYDELVFSQDEIAIEFEPDEKRRVVDALQAALDAGEPVDDESLGILAEFRAELAELDGPDAGEDQADVPKAPAS